MLDRPPPEVETQMRVNNNATGYINYQSPPAQRYEKREDEWNSGFVNCQKNKNNGTYNTGNSLVVTDPTTTPALARLS